MTARAGLTARLFCCLAIKYRDLTVMIMMIIVMIKMMIMMVIMMMIKNEFMKRF